MDEGLEKMIREELGIGPNEPPEKIIETIISWRRALTEQLFKLGPKGR